MISHRPAALCVAACLVSGSVMAQEEPPAGWAVDYAAPPVTRTMVLELGSLAEAEIKVPMRAGAMIHYTWSLEGAPDILVDFHGHTRSFDRDIYYARGAAAGGSGALMAPFEGDHGWYFANRTVQPVTITVTVTGDDVALLERPAQSRFQFGPGELDIDLDALGF